jgi:hypothetical protein
MQPDPVNRLASVVEDVLAAQIGVHNACGAVGESQKRKIHRPLSTGWTERAANEFCRSIMSPPPFEQVSSADPACPSRSREAFRFHFPLRYRWKSAQAGFDHHIVKLVDPNVLFGLLSDLQPSQE